MKILNSVKVNLIVWLNCILLMHSSYVWSAKLEATVDRTRVVEGDSLVLSLVATENNQGNPDVSVLQQDFEVLNQSHSTRMTITNGSAETSSEWQITLIPKRTGRLTIPSISVGNAVSDPILLQVLPANQANKIGTYKPMLLEVDTNIDKPYVQAQVIYTVRILSKVNIRQAELTEPKADNAIIERLGTDTNYQTERDGYTYQVTERRYAIFPQRSGKLTIDAPVLTATIPDSNRQRLLLKDPFFSIPFGDPFADLNSRQIQTRGQDVTLDVQPQPINGGTPWLPATNIQLTETWSQDPPQFKVGEPITRTLIITAQGLSVAQIPDFTPSLPPGIKSYPDKTQSENQVKDSNIVATKILKQALVPAKSGSMTLPEVQLAWWNTQTNQPQIALVPARTIQILSLPISEPLSTNNLTPVAPPTLTQTPQNKLIQPTLSTSVTTNNPVTINYWMWLASLLGSAWILTLILWWRDRYRHRTFSHATKVVSIDLSRAKAAIKYQCLANNPRAAKAALLDWGKIKWSNQPPIGLNELALRFNSMSANTVLQQIDQHLYSNQTNATWDGANAWSVLAPLLKSNATTLIKEKPLPDLYPILSSN